jgi:F-type H+-transporting ATPase subunit epsilon
MSSQFHVDIITPEKVVYRDEILSLVVPAELGYLGVLANHAPLIAHLVKGKIILRDNQGKTEIFHSEGNGFIEVLKNKVTLILEASVYSLPEQAHH